MGWENAAALAWWKWQRYGLKRDTFTQALPVALAAGSPSAPPVCVRALLGWVHPTASLRLPGGPHQAPPPAKPLLLSSPHSPTPPPPAFFPPVFFPHLLYQQDINVTNAAALPSLSQISFQHIRLQMCAVPLPGPSTHQSSLMCCSKVHLNMWPHPWNNSLSSLQQH